MDEKRRQFLMLGVTVAMGTIVPQTDSHATNAPQIGEGIPNAAAGSLRLVTYALRPGMPGRIGALTAEGRIVDIGQAARHRGVSLPFDATQMVSLIAAGDPALAIVNRLVNETKESALPLTDVILHAPIPKPTRNVYAVGWNYLEHFQEGSVLRETAVELPEHPVFFTKAVNTVNGPFDPIPFDPRVSSMIDWEGELAVIIGKGGKNISESDAMAHVFGYCVINDTTARDIQHKRHGEQWFKGKSLDGHGPLGPWIVTAHDIDYDNLHLTTRVNGVIKQQANTKQMYFKVPRIISELSLGLTLEPGDIIATGTPPGIGAVRKPQEFLKPGDILETEIAELGLIRNVITAV
jgi:2-keto-4-pentenoate hydratase/2-oxohepta-3-ene-1,7-dioic acid hydratase in catechol pathway